ncbi:MAG TPA: hypothetical protein VGY48_18815 [Vicinamibacterales bacterium]|nr:hypothetical protein [Vicinamibacterales bacterium]
MIIPPVHRRIPGGDAIAAAIGLCTLLLGIAAALYYHRIGLTLSHYDARGHLVVARRIFDSITPGWQQIGAVWLPLPHLLNALPVQIDFLYRTGASAVAISVASFAVAAGAVAWIVVSATGSEAAGACAALVFALNPNVLYLQSTPMTEPLLVALTTLAVAMLIDWTEHVYSGGSCPPVGPRGRGVGAVLALGCLTRYEAWPVTAVALTLAAWAIWRRSGSPRLAMRAVAAVAAYPAVAVIGFTVFSRVVIGEWFVSDGFFVPENKARGDLMLAAREIAWGTRMVGGAALVWLGLAGVAALVVMGLASRRRVEAIIAVALGATAATPLVAFYKGHPFRIRYMVPLIAIEAIGAGVAAGTVGIVGIVPRARLPAAAAVALLAMATLRPFDATAPMVIEAQWDRPNAPVRARVTACLGRPRPGEKIMASMGSLGHYMQEASAAGYELRDFLHEGNGDIWLAAIEHPRPFADWLLIEEKAEGGDLLAHIARDRPRFLDGYSRVCDGAGLALYRRDMN